MHEYHSLMVFEKATLFHYFDVTGFLNASIKAISPDLISLNYVD